VLTKTCNECNRVAFAVTREQAEKEVFDFGKYFKTLPKKLRQDFYGNIPSTIKDYEQCLYCNNHHSNFRDSQPGDSPIGCTLSPIITE